MNGLSQTVRTLGPGRLLVMGIVGAGMMGFFLFLASRLATPGLVLLYSDLEMSDSGQIVGQLETMGVPYRLAGNGADHTMGATGAPRRIPDPASSSTGACPALSEGTMGRARTDPQPGRPA